MIQIYCGDGKGKTTAAVGAAVRAAGSGLRVVFAQFLKDGSSSEIVALRALGIDCRFAAETYALFSRPTPEKQARLRAAYNELLRTLAADAADYDMLVLDEVLDALQLSLADETCMQPLLALAQGTDRELLLTGRQAPPAIAGAAHYISRITAVRHPYASGTPARRGIEY